MVVEKKDCEQCKIREVCERDLERIKRVIILYYLLKCMLYGMLYLMK